MRRQILDLDERSKRAVFTGEDGVVPAVGAVRGHTREERVDLAIGMNLLKFVHQLSFLEADRAFVEAALGIGIHKHDGALLGIPEVKAVDVRHRFAVDDELVADPDGLPIFRPSEARVDAHLLAVR